MAAESPTGSQHRPVPPRNWSMRWEPWSRPASLTRSWAASTNRTWSRRNRSPSRPLTARFPAGCTVGGPGPDRCLRLELWRPDKDRDMLVERSPITYVENVRCPMLVLQGAHDPRVVKADSDQMVDRLRALGREVEYIVYDDEGHGFLKRENTVSAFRAASTFLNRQLEP
ncbi:MAG: alpha/beta hydrolase family protein [Bacillota bacterium]